LVLNCLASLPDGIYQIVLVAENRLISARILHKN